MTVVSAGHQGPPTGRANIGRSKYSSSAKLWCMVCMAVMVMSGIIIMLVYFTAGDDKEVNLGPGNDLFVIKKSSGLHLIEVDNSGSTGVGQGWVWLELVCLGLAILLGLTISHVMYYCYCT